MLMAPCVSARVSDGLYFDLKTLGDVNGNGTADLSELVNALAVGASDGGAAIYGRNLFYSTENKYRRFYSNSPERQVVNIKQTYEEHPDGTKWLSKVNALVFTNRVYSGLCENGRTMFCRFRWDGYPFPDPAVTKSQAFVATDSWDYNGNTGYGFCINPSGSSSLLQVWVGNKNNSIKRNSSTFGISSNEWYDVMFRLTTDGTKTDVKMMWGNRGTCEEWNDTAEFATPLVANANGRLVIGSENNYNTWVAFNKTETGPKSFNGRIAELKIWDRALDDDEAKAVFAEAWGETVALGAVNGSSDEFGADPQVVFDPATMNCGQMRKELTAGNPSLFIETAFKAEEDGIGKSILVTPVLVGAAACPVQLFVNGELEDEATLLNGTEAALRVRRRKWKANGLGRIALEIRRVGNLAGTLGIDALSFGGGWQLGKDDNGWTDFSAENGADAYANYYIGDLNVSNHLRRAIFETGGSQSQTKVVLNTYVPASLTRVKAWLKFEFLNKKTGSATSPWTIKLNGATFWSNDLAKGDVVEIEIPAGTFRAGLNALAFSHDSPQASEWAGMDYYRLVFADKPRGMTLLFR